MFAIWVLTLGVFAEGNACYLANESVKKPQFVGGEKSVFVSAFVTEHGRSLYGIPFVFAINRPVAPYALHIAVSARKDIAPIGTKVVFSSVRLVSEDGRANELLSVGEMVEKSTSSHRLFGREVIGCNLTFDTAVLAVHGKFRVDVAGLVEGKHFKESVEMESWNQYSFYPGWFKLVYLDQFSRRAIK